MAAKQDVDRLVSELMASATSVNERKAVAELADAGFFADENFRRTCLRMKPRPEVVWKRVMMLRWGLPQDDHRIGVLERSVAYAQHATANIPKTLAELQVAIEIDQPDGLTLAAWRDVYLSDYRDPNPYLDHVDMCLNELHRRGECWNCGRPADEDDDGQPVCSTCNRAT